MSLCFITLAGCSTKKDDGIDPVTLLLYQFTSERANYGCDSNVNLVTLTTASTTPVTLKFAVRPNYRGELTAWVVAPVINNRFYEINFTSDSNTQLGPGLASNGTGIGTGCSSAGSGGVAMSTGTASSYTSTGYSPFMSSDTRINYFSVRNITQETNIIFGVTARSDKADPTSYGITSGTISGTIVKSSFGN